MLALYSGFCYESQWEVANVLYGEHSRKAGDWARKQGDRIEQGKARAVIESLRFLSPVSQAQREAVDKLVGYLRENLDRMDYPAYRALGLRVGSGAIESANFHVTGARLKLQGMRWSLNGAANMAMLRADLFNGRWEQSTRQLLAG